MKVFMRFLENPNRSLTRLWKQSKYVWQEIEQSHCWLGRHPAWWCFKGFIFKIRVGGVGAKQAFVLLISCFIHWMVWLDLVWSAVHFFQQSSRAFYWLRQTVTSQISYHVIRLFLVIKRKDQSRHKLSNGLIYPLQFKDISQYLLLWKE